MALEKKPPFSICLQQFVDMTTRSISNKARQQYEEIRQSTVDRKKRFLAAKEEKRETTHHLADMAELEHLTYEIGPSSSQQHLHLRLSLSQNVCQS